MGIFVGHCAIEDSPMKIFLSYSSRDRRKAEEVALALEARGHNVFFDRDDLAGGDDFHAVIRRHITGADLFVFLISPESVRAGAFTLTELKWAREKWSHPRKHVLPVLLEPTAMEQIPAYLKGVTILEPEGNVAAEIAAHLSPGRRRRKAVIFAAAAAVVVILAIGLYPQVRRFIAGDSASFLQKAELSAFESILVFQPEQIQKMEYALDPHSSFPQDRGDVVTVERIVFGRIDHDDKALQITVAVTNPTEQPILLDLTHRFFELEDDQGRKAELLYFCCSAAGEILGPGQRRQIQLLFRSAPGWEGKGISAQMIYFRIQGLLPLVRGTWMFRPLATAA
jgi:hypothetical protein